MTSGKGPPPEKASWWWSEEVQRAVKEKKEAKKQWERSREVEDKDRFRQANKRAKKAVAKAKAGVMEELYKEPETPEGEKKIYRIAKARDKATKDFTHIKK